MNNHIDHIEITNFKSIRHQKIEGCKRINVFIGYPNVGKSNILEALALLTTRLADSENNFSFGTICRVRNGAELYQLYFNHDYKSDIILKINDDLEVKASLNRAQSSLTINIGRTAESSVFGKNIGSVIINNNLSINQVSNLDKSYSLSPIKYYTFKKDVAFKSGNSIPLSIPYGNNLLDVLQRENDFRKDLSNILKEYDLKLTINKTTNSLMLLKDLDESTVVNIPYDQIADTVRRLIFYKAAIASNQNAILLFEEPEAHMFPPYISKLTSDVIYDKKNENQYFIATHSPFVVNDFLSSAREDLSVYLVGYKKGETIIKRMTDKQLHEVYQHGVDLFFNLEDYIK